MGNEVRKTNKETVTTFESMKEVKYIGTQEKEKAPKRQLLTNLTIQREEINIKDTGTTLNNTNKSGHFKITEENSTYNVVVSVQSTTGCKRNKTISK